MRTIITFLSCLAALHSLAQQSPFSKFGKVSAVDLQKKFYAVDSNASAVVLSDIGRVKIKGNNKGFFSLSFVHHKVIHILSRAGYNMADIEINLFKNGEDVEKLENIKGYTYNLENGKVKETKLDKSNIFTDKMDKNWVVKKFTMPNVKEGSIIEMEYEVSSDFLRHIDPWNFQGEAPRLWSEFVLSAPSFFTYTFLSHGYQKLFLQDKKDKIESFSVTIRRDQGLASNPETVNFSAGVTDFRWVMKDVPGLKMESFTSALENHTSRIEFQLAAQGKPLEPHSFIESWPDLTKELDASEGFGHAYKEIEEWMPGDFSRVVANSKNQDEKALKVFEYVRDNFTCTGNKGIYIDGPIRNVVKTKKGKTAELNLMLVGLLRSSGFVSYPVVISTTPNGYAYKEYASLSQFNYVIVQVEVEGKKYYLDASHPHLGFGKLLPECYNGHARVVNEEATAVYLMPESVTEKKVATLFMTGGKDGNLVGTMKQFPGYFESYYTRQKINESGEQEFFKQVEKDLGGDFKVSNPKVDSLKNYNTSLGLIYDVQLATGQPDIIYLNPLFGEGYKKNPFESAQRYYPVEMPFLIDETFVLSLDVPKGYMVDELPRQLIARTDEKGSGQFEYRIAQQGQTISLRMTLRFTKTNFSSAEYDTLREFFGMVVSKQSEQIVFKKIKN